MKIIKKISCWLLACALLPAVCFGDETDDVYAPRDTQLRAAFLQFPFVTPATNDLGKPAFQNFKLTNAVIIAGMNYYGFRFKVPARANHEDLVWAFILPKGLSVWYVLPQTDPEQGFNGFKDFLEYPRKNYPELHGLFPTDGKKVELQHLSGKSLADGQEYLIWFSFGTQKPNWMSFEFTFAKLTEKGAHRRGLMEKLLNLHSIPLNADLSLLTD
jgi:hypothetical protein